MPHCRSRLDPPASKVEGCCHATPVPKAAGSVGVTPLPEVTSSSDLPLLAAMEGKGEEAIIEKLAVEGEDEEVAAWRGMRRGRWLVLLMCEEPSKLHSI